MNNIVFVTKNNNNFYKLELAKTLLFFVEYDFTYFWEQAIELGTVSRNMGGYGTKQVQSVKCLIAKCHPYYEAQMNSDFENIVLDCIIEYICHSENISLEELWTRCISPKSLYEKSIFSRISEYKTGRGINQWENLVRTQEYAKIKLSYLFDGPPAAKQVYITRKNYFDLCFSVMAKELGLPSVELPAAKTYNPALMPNAAFALSRASRGILKKIEPIVDAAQEQSCLHIREAQRDKVSLDTFRYLKNLPRPSDMEMDTLHDIFSGLAPEVYLPDSFKAIIDLEFDKMMEEGLFFQQCEKCKKYFIQDMNYVGRFCNRVNASGQTCREQEQSDEEPDHSPLTRELEERCDLVSEMLESRVDDGMEEHEFREWAQYLTNMKENVQNEYSSAADLEAFLDYSERMAADAKLAVKLTNPEPPPPKPPEPVSLDKDPEGGEKKPIIRKMEWERLDSSALHVQSFDEPDFDSLEPPPDKPEPKKYHFPTLAELEQMESHEKR